MNIIIKISKKKIINNVIKNNTKHNGAVVSFLGIIKDKNNNKKVKHIHYSIFNNLFFSVLKKYCTSILKNKKEISIYINQYSGIAYVGQINLIIYVKSKDRKNAFSVCHKLLEFIKYNSPVWKKETYADGTSKWINA
ncbi:MAG TPA: molybdenum cofactor biosynthesis protein MoaE [Candidatus Azoamicus sp. MARI]